MNRNRAVLKSAIVLYFVICLEILIMISPFAGFFYSVFNPFLLGLARYPATRWLSSFFLPHMVVPPDDFLKFIRIMGSVLFVGGIVVFLACAVQVYVNKFLGKGAVSRGLYSFIRHPQYLSLAVTGIGLAILWPRFLVAVLWLPMVLIYYFLSKDEERRMLKEYPDTYRQYMERTGMLLPGKVESLLSPATAAGKTILVVVICAFTIGSAFFLRAYTVRHLPLWTDGNVVALAVLPEDSAKMEHRMGDILNMGEVKARLKSKDRYLVYFLPPNYIMQGLIANTGGEWKLYKHQHSIGMFADWIIHPFSHLRKGHHMMHRALAHPGHNMGIQRRLIFLKVNCVRESWPYDALSIDAGRTPDFMVDIDVHGLVIHNLKELPKNTGWGKVPTPVF